MFEQWPLESLLGGVLIGTSAALLLAFNGRTAGISGILYNLLLNPLSHTERSWRLCFIVGLIGGGYLMMPVGFELRQGYSPSLLIISGLAVGIGTRMSNGCTSGHGVCGIGLMARRSIAATAMFMASGILTVTLLRSFTG